MTDDKSCKFCATSFHDGRAYHECIVCDGTIVPSNCICGAPATRICFGTGYQVGCWECGLKGPNFFNTDTDLYSTEDNPLRPDPGLLAIKAWNSMIKEGGPYINFANPEVLQRAVSRRPAWNRRTPDPVVSELVEFMESERACFSLRYDEGMIIWEHGKSHRDMYGTVVGDHVTGVDKESEDSRPYRDNPYELFTIGSQHVRGVSVLDVVKKAMAEKRSRLEARKSGGLYG